MALKIAAQAFEAGDSLNIFLRIYLFWGSFSYKNYSYNENVYMKNKVSDNVINIVDRAIEKFKTPPSLLITKDNVSQENKFSFTEVSQSEIENKIKNLQC